MDKVQSLENDKRVLLEFIMHQYGHSVPTRYLSQPLVSINVTEFIQAIKSASSPTAMAAVTATNGHTGAAAPHNHSNISPPKSNTPTLHSSLLPSPPYVATGTPPIITTPDTYGHLTKEQLHLASYETYLLVNHFTKPTDQRNTNEEDSFRIQMEISKVKHDLFIKMFTIKAQHKELQPPRFHSVTFRLWTMRYADFSGFDTMDSMMLWWRRQMYVVLTALANMLKDPFDEKSPSPAVLSTLRQHCFNVESCLAAMPAPGSVDYRIYSQAFEILDSYIASSVLQRTSPKNISPSQQRPLATEYLNEPIAYTFPLNTNMYEDLLFYTLFEFSNDEIVYVGNDTLETSSCLVPMSMALRISEPMSKICHLNCFLTSYQAELREDHFIRLKKSLDIIEEIITNSPTTIQDPSFATASLLKLTLKKIAQWLLKLLSDVHSHKSEHTSRDIELACSIYVQSREMWNMLSSYVKYIIYNRRNKSMKTTESNFTAFLTSSISCHYGRISKPYRPLTLDNFSTFVEQLIKEIALNLRVYTRGFAKHHGNAASCALQEFVNLYSMDLKVVFGDVYFLSPQVLQSVQTSSDFQLFLQDLKLLPLEKLPPVTEYVSTVISSWCQNQEKSFNKWFENMFQVDKFTPMDKDHKHSSSVLDMFQMFYQTLGTLSKMKGSLGTNFAGFIITLSGMFNKCLIIYNQTIAEISLQNQKQHLYPFSLNEKIKKKGAFRKSVNSLTSSATGVGSRESEKYNVSPTLITKFQNQSLQTLIVCLNNLDFIYKNVNDYVEHHSYADVNLKKSLADMFLPTQSSMKNSATALIDYIGAKVVFIDLKETFIDICYMFPLSQRTRVDEPLESLNPHLRTIYTNVSSTERGNDVLTAVCKAFLQGLEYLILYGGPNRIYSAKDSDLIDLDIETIKDYFLDRDEQGVAKAVQELHFDGFAKNLRKVVNVLMDQGSEILIEQYSGVNSGTSKTAAAGFGKEVLMAILVHRNDKPARSFIKKKSTDHFYLQIKKNSKVNFLTQ
ncbi:hypothetical protein DFA_01471 [Cavenderia fasciculata]|uniref:Uncharacterized protein n=1 Tax=Cavenderia fasciculata TaxID=261658 RepID=F4PT09_CACFS|nr:uncharacterized protein DFA_01471 [Cavenderia fasciculata]EGG21585.1 hypothetical protein DFA_01471 [Cavenderia fasciculata]|eukprot:XP_004359435.1 hypothetical protein DFA_01471 [Cavenderia fasciculata]